MGHAWKAADRRPTNPSNDSEDYDFWVDLGYRHLDEYFEDTFKASERIIRDNAHRFVQLHALSEIIVLGHSLAEVDYYYFEAIAKHVDMRSVRWTTTYFREDERDAMTATLTSLGVPASHIGMTTLEAMRCDVDPGLC